MKYFLTVEFEYGDNYIDLETLEENFSGDNIEEKFIESIEEFIIDEGTFEAFDDLPKNYKIISARVVE
jgi:hypothetical protein